MMIRLFLALSGFLFLHAAMAATAPRPHTIYGIENGARLNPNSHADRQYFLQAGAYKDKSNALRSLNRYRHETRSTVRLISPKSPRGNYFVVIGPFSSAQELRRISQELQSSAQTTMKAPKQATQVSVKTTAPSQKQKIATIKPTVPSPTTRLIREKVPEPLLRQARRQSPILLDHQTQQDNQFAREMQTNGKIHVISREERLSLETRTWSLKSQSEDLGARLKTETDDGRSALLKKKKEQVDQELGQIVAMVVKRISRD